MESYKQLVLLLPLFFSIESYASTIELKKCGTDWINIHKDNPELVGIHVQQLPDDIKDRDDYTGKHPVMIIYLFKGDRAHTVTYTPIGQVQNGVWWNTTKDHWVKNSLVDDNRINIECAYWK